MKNFFKLILLIGIICTVQQISYAQKTNYQIKGYYNFLHTSYEANYGDPALSQVVEHASTNFGVITPAFVVAKNKVRHEIELSNFRINNNKNVVTAPVSNGGTVTVSGSNVFNIYIGIRYEFAFNLLDAKSSHGLFFGASVQPYLDYVRTVPKTNASFPIRTSYLGTRLHLIPRYTYDISKKWLIDVNFPIEITDLLEHRQYREDLAIPERLRCQRGTQTNFFDKVFQFRIGIGLKL